MKILLSDDAGETRVKLEGDLDETATDALEAIRGKLASRIVFDWAKTRKLNSIGVGAWIDFLDALPPATTYRFVNATVGFVAYANALRPFLGRGKVESLDVPFYCAACDDSSATRVEVKAILPGPALAEQPCPRCKKATVPDIALGHYLGFLKA